MISEGQVITSQPTKYRSQSPCKTYCLPVCCVKNSADLPGCCCGKGCCYLLGWGPVVTTAVCCASPGIALCALGTGATTVVVVVVGGGGGATAATAATTVGGGAAVGGAAAAAAVGGVAAFACGAMGGGIAAYRTGMCASSCCSCCGPSSFQIKNSSGSGLKITSDASSHNHRREKMTYV